MGFNKVFPDWAILCFKVEAACFAFVPMMLLCFLCKLFVALNSFVFSKNTKIFIR